jgi:hypothetical protein
MFNPALFALLYRPSDPPVVNDTPVLPPVYPMVPCSHDDIRKSMMLTNQILEDMKAILGN